MPRSSRHPRLPCTRARGFASLRQAGSPSQPMHRRMLSSARLSRFAAFVRERDDRAGCLDGDECRIEIRANRVAHRVARRWLRRRRIDASRDSDQQQPPHAGPCCAIRAGVTARTVVAVFYSSARMLAWTTATARLVALAKVEVLGEALFNEIVDAGV